MREQSLKELIQSKSFKPKANAKALSFNAGSKRTCFNKALSFNSGKSVEAVRSKALYIAQKLNNEKDMNFYLKCAWSLDEKTIDDILERSEGKNCAINYFAKAASGEMRLLALAS